MTRSSRRRWRPSETAIEQAILVLGVAALTLYAEWPIVSDPLAFQSDSATHEWWMRRFRDPELFRDPLTEAVLDGAWVPPGIIFLYRLAAYVMDPLTFAEWVPVVLVPLSALLIFKIVRAHTGWRLAPWLAVALFLAPFEVHRFSGGHARAYMHPVVLLCVYLAIRNKRIVAIVPAVGFLLYPPAGVVSAAILGLSSLRWEGRPRLDITRAQVATVAVVLLAAAIFIPRVVDESPPQILTRAEAQALPEYGPDGQFHFFRGDFWEEMKANYSGFFLRGSGSLVVVAALLVLLFRTRIRPPVRREVWAMAAGSLLLFIAAHLLLFRLYLPHRYTYPLIPFCAIFIAISWPSLWDRVARATRHPLPAMVLGIALPALVIVIGLSVFPLGPQLSTTALLEWFSDHWVGPTVAALAAAGTLAVIHRSSRGIHGPAFAFTLCAVVAGVLLVGGTAAEGFRRSRPSHCKNRNLNSFLASTPKSTIVAGHPFQLNCVPLAARRPVVITRKLYQPWDREFLDFVRPRMFAAVRAYYGTSVEDVLTLRREYGADLFVINRASIKENLDRKLEPFSSLVASLDQTAGEPLVATLPDGCVVFDQGVHIVYDLRCVDSSV